MYLIAHGRNSWTFGAWDELVAHVVDHSIPFDANDDDDALLYAVEEDPGVEHTLRTARALLLRAQGAIRDEVNGLRGGVDEGFDAAYDGWVIRWAVK